MKCFNQQSVFLAIVSPNSLAKVMFIVSRNRTDSMKRMKKNKINHKQKLLEQLDGVSTINFVSNAASIFEKLFWIVLALTGSAWILSVIVNQVIHWEENPVIKTEDFVKLSDVKKPSITFCTKGLLDHGIMERMGNYIDPEKKTLEGTMELNSEMIKEALIKKMNEMCLEHFSGFSYFNVWSCQVKNLKLKIVLVI